MGSEGTGGDGKTTAISYLDDDIRSAQQGDMDAWAKIYLENYPMVYRACLALCRRDTVQAQDLASSTFTKALVYLYQYQGKRPIKHWFKRIARNEYINGTRKEHKIFYEACLASRIDAQIRPENSLEGYDYELLERLILGLPERQRDTLLLTLEGYDFKEIADRQDISYNTAKANYRHAWKSIQKKLKRP